MTGNRVMRLNNNPNARGFIVRVLEETHRDEMDRIHFKVIASATAGTKARAPIACTTNCAPSISEPDPCFSTSNRTFRLTHSSFCGFSSWAQSSLMAITATTTATANSQSRSN